MRLPRETVLFPTPDPRRRTEETMTTLSQPVRRPRRPRGGATEISAAAIGPLLAHALEACREGAALSWTAAAPGPVHARSDPGGVPAPRLGPLPATDRSALARLEPQREQALARSRAGRTAEAENAMRGARVLLAFSGLSGPGRAYAETMQQAAESYLSYRRGDGADACARMEAAVTATDRLAGWWGESEFIVCRRMDLMHNLMRVDLRREALEDSMRMGARLLASLTGPEAAGATALDPRISATLANLVAGTVAELLAPLPPERARTLFALLGPSRGAGEGPSPRVAEWIELKEAILGDEPERFLARADSFLREGRGRTATLWYAVVLDLLRLTRDTDAAGVLAVPFAAAAKLLAGDGVPPRMRMPA